VTSSLICCLPLALCLLRPPLPLIHPSVLLFPTFLYSSLYFSVSFTCFLYFSAHLLPSACISPLLSYVSFSNSAACLFVIIIKSKNQTPSPGSASELYRLSDRRFSTRLVPTVQDRGRRVVSATDPHDRILGFLDRSRYFFFQVAPQLYSRG
jgi:hypothetical protein